MINILEKEKNAMMGSSESIFKKSSSFDEIMFYRIYFIDELLIIITI